MMHWWWYVFVETCLCKGTICVKVWLGNKYKVESVIVHHGNVFVEQKIDLGVSGKTNLTSDQNEENVWSICKCTF